MQGVRVTTEPRRPCCPSCLAIGEDPRTVHNRTTWRYQHADGCRIAAVIEGAATPRTEHDYLTGRLAFELADHAEKGITR
jgi:hypothetical protein